MRIASVAAAGRGPGRRALLVTLLAAALAAGGCGSHHRRAAPRATTGPGTPAATEVPPVAWGPCSRSYTGHYDCARLPVPLDHARPSGTRIEIALIRTRATGHKIGSLLVNPGGPGVSAVADWDSLSGSLDRTLHERFDVIGFDPRGVGDSAPVRCADSTGVGAYLALNFAPRDAAETTALVDGARQFAAGCLARSGALLPFIGTRDAARDMDDIRAAVGDQRLTYLGLSYGTYLGAAYADQFPSRVRALALDGALDPTVPPVRSADTQSRAFQRQLDRFLADCAGRAGCRWKVGGDPHAALRALLARIDSDPPPGPDGRRLHAGEAFFGLGYALYDPQLWPTLAGALAAAGAGNGGPLLQLSDYYTDRNPDGSYLNSTEANLAINCRDAAWPRSPQGFLAADSEAAAAAPDFGVSNLNLALGCAFFPPQDSGAPVAPLTARGAPPILVIATTGDPATPYDDGVALARQLSSGVLLTNVGEQHTAYLYSSCVRRAVDAYLTDLKVPATQARCSNG